MKLSELTLSVPADGRYGAVLLALASHAALHAGCDEAAAADFTAAVDDAWQGCIRSGSTNPDANQDADQDGGITIVLRRQAGELDVTFTCGRTVRVARTLPPDE